MERPGRPEQEHGAVVPCSHLSIHVQRERDMLQVFKPAFLYFHSQLRNPPFYYLVDLFPVKHQHPLYQLPHRLYMNSLEINLESFKIHT